MIVESDSGMRPVWLAHVCSELVYTWWDIYIYIQNDEMHINNMMLVLESVRVDLGNVSSVGFLDAESLLG